MGKHSRSRRPGDLDFPSPEEDEDFQRRLREARHRIRPRSPDKKLVVRTTLPAKEAREMLDRAEGLLAAAAESADQEDGMVDPELVEAVVLEIHDEDDATEEVEDVKEEELPHVEFDFDYLSLEPPVVYDLPPEPDPSLDPEPEPEPLVPSHALEAESVPDTKSLLAASGGLIILLLPFVLLIALLFMSKQQRYDSSVEAAKQERQYLEERLRALEQENSRLRTTYGRMPKDPGSKGKWSYLNPPDPKPVHDPKPVPEPNRAKTPSPKEPLPKKPRSPEEPNEGPEEITPDEIAPEEADLKKDTLPPDNEDTPAPHKEVPPAPGEAENTPPPYPLTFKVNPEDTVKVTPDDMMEEEPVKLKLIKLPTRDPKQSRVQISCGSVAAFESSKGREARHVDVPETSFPVVCRCSSSEELKSTSKMVKGGYMIVCRVKGAGPSVQLWVWKKKK